MKLLLVRNLYRFGVLVVLVSFPVLGNDDPITAVDVYRFDGKRYLKISVKDASVFLPSIGMDPETDFLHAICPKEAREIEDSIEIRKNVEISEEIKAKDDEIKKVIYKCQGVNRNSGVKTKPVKKRLRVKSQAAPLDEEIDKQPGSAGVEVELKEKSKNKNK